MITWGLVALVVGMLADRLTSNRYRGLHRAHCKPSPARRPRSSPTPARASTHRPTSPREATT